MRDVQHRLWSLQNQASELRAQFIAQLGIQVAHRFIQQINARIAQKGSAEGHPLPLTA